MWSRLLGPLILALIACAGASAQTAVRCDLQPFTALGNAIALANPGEILAITGLCRQQVTVASAFDLGITITNETGLVGAPLRSGDGIAGRIQISGPLQVTISGIVLEGTSTDLGYQSVISVLGGSVVIANSQIANGWRHGLLATGNGVAALLNTTVSRNGRAGIAGQGDGIRATDGARILLGQHNADGSIDAGNEVTVEDNGGNGISAIGNSSVSLVGGAVDGNDGYQIFVSGSSAAAVFGAQVTQTRPSSLAEAYAVKVSQASQLFLAQRASVRGGTYSGGVLVRSASSLAMLNSTISNNMPTLPTLTASGGSHIDLSGGNVVGASASGATAISLNLLSSLIQGQGADLAPTIAGAPVAGASSADSITGNGVVNSESVMELGENGSIPVAWDGGITITMNSSLRLDGGSSISGSLSIEQGSYGSFAGTNVVTNGVTCPAINANSRLSLAAGASVVTRWSGGKNALTMAPAPNGCLGF